MSTEEETAPVPNWLLKLEEQRARRLKVKLGHEAGAGAPCQKCGDKCPGLDLHFWRKICKLCKCGKEDHDITDDDMFDFVQFQLLGSKPVKSKGMFLKGRKDEVILEWTPNGSSNDVKKYLDELPADLIPVKGSEAAKIRKQRLQKQMPAHDIDPTLCDNLTEDEIKELEEYVAHIRKHCVGQGKIIRLSLLKGNQHKLANPNAQFLTQFPPAQLASSQTVFLQSSDLANNLHNLSLRDKPMSNVTNRIAFLNSQVPNENVVTNLQEVNPTLVGKSHNLIYPVGSTENVGNMQDNMNYPNESTGNLRKTAEYPNFAPKSLHQVVDSQNPVMVPSGKITDVNYPLSNEYPQSTDFTSYNPNLGGQNPSVGSQKPGLLSQKPVLPSHYPNASINPGIYEQNQSIINPTNTIHYPLTTSNVEKHQEQFENPNFELNNANVDRVLNPHLNYAPNFIKPIEQHQMPSAVGQPKDLKYSSNVLGTNIDDKMNTNLPYGTYPTERGQMPVKVGQIKDLKYFDGSQSGMPTQGNNFPSGYPSGNKQVPNPNVPYNPNYYNPNQTNLPSHAGQPGYGKYPDNIRQGIDQPGNTKFSDNMQPGDPKFPRNLPISKANIDKIPGTGLHYNPNYINPIEQTQLPTQIGQLKDLKYPTNMLPNNENVVPNQQYPPNNYINPNESHKVPHKYGQKNDENISGDNLQNKKIPNYPTGTNLDKIAGFDQNTVPSQFGQHSDAKYPDNIQSGQLNPGQKPKNFVADGSSGHTGFNPNDPTNLAQFHDINSQDLKHRPQIPVLQAQSAINPFEDQQNLQSVGFIRDIDYPSELGNQEIPPELPSTDPYDIVNSNNAVLPSCHECKQLFEHNAVAVSADRSTNLWHAGCFNCHTCKQPLADLLYFYHKETDNIYCGRDYAILKGIPRCAACDELIFVREYCLAEESTFHIKHFCCFECDGPLAGKQYVMEGSQPLCLDCYENLKAEKCNDCGNVIRPDEQGVSLQNLHWHAEDTCFACKYCRKPLLGNKMLLRNNNLFCSDVCFKTFR